MNGDHDYVRRRVTETCAAQGMDVVPSPEVLDAVSVLLALDVSPTAGVAA